MTNTQQEEWEREWQVQLHKLCKYNDLCFWNQCTRCKQSCDVFVEEKEELLEEWEDKLSNFLQDWDITVKDPFFEKAIWELFRSSIQQARKEAQNESKPSLK